MTSYRADKPNFLEFWVKMAKMTLKVKANHLHFQYQPRVSQDACLVQIWWFQLKSVTSYRADKVKFTDGHRRTQATTIPLRPERPRGKNAFETIICEMAAILSRRRWVNQKEYMCLPKDLIDNKSRLDQVMTWCWPAPSHCLLQSTPRSMFPYGITQALVNWTGTYFSRKKLSKWRLSKT